MSAEVLQALKAATDGLLYASETDSPFELVHWPRKSPTLTGSGLVSLIGKKPNVRVEEVGLEKFFQDLIQDQDWHDDHDKKIVERYRNLLAVLKKQLTDAKVFKVGKVQIDIYIVGRTSDGEWVGTKTSAVET